MANFSFMKNLLVLLIFCFAIASPTFAQIIIDQSDMPSAGNSYVRANGNLLTDLDFTQTGEDQTWDYSSLESTGLNTTNCISISEAPFLYQFLFNNPLSPNYQATYAVAGEGIDLGLGFTLDEFFQFNKVSATALSAVGYGATLSGVPVPSGTNPIDVIYSLPMTMNSTHQNYSEWLIEVPETATYQLKQTRSYVVDGYGTLILPDGEYEVLRLTMNIEALDSIYINQFNFGFEIPRNTVEYHWLSLDEGLPVLQVNSLLGTTSSISYKTNDVPDNILQQNKSRISIYPNPAQNSLFIDQAEMGSSYEIIDLQGRKVSAGSIDAELFHIDLSALSSGSYVINLLGQEYQSFRFQKQ